MRKKPKNKYQPAHHHKKQKWPLADQMKKYSVHSAQYVQQEVITSRHKPSQYIQVTRS
jgi:hypothetical protein